MSVFVAFSLVSVCLEVEAQRESKVLQIMVSVSEIEFDDTASTS